MLQSIFAWVHTEMIFLYIKNLVWVKQIVFFIKFQGSEGGSNISKRQESDSEPFPRFNRSSWKFLNKSNLNLGLDILDGVARFHLQGDRLPRQSLHEYLHFCRLWSFNSAWFKKGHNVNFHLKTRRLQSYHNIMVKFQKLCQRLQFITGETNLRPEN